MIRRLVLQHLLGVDEDIRRLALETARRLMDVQARIEQRHPRSPSWPAIGRTSPSSGPSPYTPCAPAP